ncbi:hypothetical protein H1D32_04075 [Anaerobacillus sp. CMMVII]|uniref:hypothetical protein n=1 Tax=Anaerobacillus sp. CMMVII TaxID=2755588 RepID=UPI0021B755C0|nr:hypothetical protein [Anaerobacillus sp. CMMVII]MCT8136987.1 hypothetical protein [Anaerobacillus sp. CMMVII]
MKRAYSILLLINFLLTSCNSPTLIYLGESEQWGVILKVKNYNFTADLQYIGDDIEGLVGTDIHYEIKLKSNWSAGGNQVLPESGVIKFDCDGSGCINLNNKTEVTLEWDGKQEVIVVEKLNE